MSDDSFAALVGALHRPNSGDVILIQPELSSNDVMLITVSDKQAAAFVARLSNPLIVERTDGDDNGHAWQTERLETPTEVALYFLGIKPSDLTYRLTGAGARISELDGDLYVDGEEVVVLLVDHARHVLAKLAAITRISTESSGQTYPLFERSELQLIPGLFRVYLWESGTWL